MRNQKWRIQSQRQRRLSCTQIPFASCLYIKKGVKVPMGAVTSFTSAFFGRGVLFGGETKINE